jgi:DNA-binding GntR family transcriptional regulator
MTVTDRPRLEIAGASCRRGSLGQTCRLQSLREHTLLVDALRRRDAPQAQLIAEQHMTTTRLAVLDTLREQP